MNLSNQGLSTDELEELMNSVDRYDEQESGEASLSIVQNLEQQATSVATQKFDKIQKEARRISKNLIKKLVSYYLTSEMAKDHYTIKKISVDVENLTNLYFQLKTSQYTIVRLLSDMDTMSPNPKYLEIYNKLQLGNIDILKSIKQYCQLMEVEYNNFSKTFNTNKQFEVEAQGQIQKPEVVTNVISSASPHRGSKSIIEEIQQKLLSQDEEESVIKGVILG